MSYDLDDHPSLNWLVTGGCGFIGSNLVHQLAGEEGHRVRVLDDLSVGDRDNLERVCDFTETDVSDLGPLSDLEPDTVELVVGDIRDEEITHAAGDGVDVIVHLAANAGVPSSVDDPRMDCTKNVIGTLNCLESARHNDVDRFVLASSAAPLGDVEPPVHEELAPKPKAPYGASKLAGEGYCSAYHGSFDLETVALRFGNVYGPRSFHKSSVVAKFIRRAQQGKVLEIYGDGEQTRDFIYTEDLLGAIRLSAIQDGVGGELFQIATASETTVNELVEIMVPILEDHGISDVSVTNTEPRTGDIRRNYSDTSKAKDLLGWQAETPLEQGLRETVDHMID
jgi:UDP-glucose 4-epimerase